MCQSDLVDFNTLSLCRSIRWERAAAREQVPFPVGRVTCGRARDSRFQLVPLAEQLGRCGTDADRTANSLSAF